MADVFKPKIKGKKARTWYGKIRDPKTGRWTKVNLKVTDKQVARKLLREKQQHVEQVTFGLKSSATDMPLVTHLDSFVAELRHLGRDELYIGQTEAQILKVAYWCAGLPVPQRMNWKNLQPYRDKIQGCSLDLLDSDKVDAFLASLPSSKSARTRNTYRGAVVALFSFLVRKKKLVYNPLLSVTRHRGEKKRKRRALSADQLQRLFDAARVRPLQKALLINRGPDMGKPGARLSEDAKTKLDRRGREHALIYATAYYTGLRRGELHALSVKHLRLDSGLPHIRLPG